MTVCKRHKWDHDAPCMYCAELDEMRKSPEFKSIVAAELREESMTDREKKIAEIRKAKQRADNISDYITKDIDQADDWIELLLSELERKDEEINRQIRFRQTDHLDHLKREQLLIEGLRNMVESDDKWYVGMTPMQDYAERTLKSIGIDV